MKIKPLYLLTILLWVAYIVWEIVLRIWAASQPLPFVRHDLMIIVPFLAMLSLASYLKYTGRL
ncbi:MAG: hypothetical protein AAFV95_03165 [Bacteroidota bacterium]